MIGFQREYPVKMPDERSLDREKGIAKCLVYSERPHPYD